MLTRKLRPSGSDLPCEGHPSSFTQVPFFSEPESMIAVRASSFLLEHGSTLPGKEHKLKHPRPHLQTGHNEQTLLRPANVAPSSKILTGARCTMVELFSCPRCSLCAHHVSTMAIISIACLHGETSLSIAKSCSIASDSRGSFD